MDANGIAAMDGHAHSALLRAFYHVCRVHQKEESLAGYLSEFAAVHLVGDDHVRNVGLRVFYRIDQVHLMHPLQLEEFPVVQVFVLVPLVGAVRFRLFLSPPNCFDYNPR